MNDRIYLSSPDVTEAEEAALVRAIRSGWVAPLGPEVEAFESELASYTGRAHAVALSSGTAALHLGLLTLGVQPGDMVVTSSLTFAATANAITYVSGEPAFVDADRSGNMNPQLLDQALREFRDANARVGAIIPVDLLGKVADVKLITHIAAKFGVPVLWDAAEALGATHEGRPAGSFGDAAVVSFNGNKIITTSGGGAFLTDDAEAAAHVRYLATQARQPVVHYEHTDIGFNYRLSNILAALGRAQLERLESMKERRREIRLSYRNLFRDVPGVKMFGEPSGVDGGETQDNFWLSSILVDPGLAGFTAEDLRAHLETLDIESRPIWKPMHMQPVFAGARAWVDGTGEGLFRRGLSLPSGSVLDEAHLARVLDALATFVESHHAE